MQKFTDSSKRLLDFIEKSPSCFHAVENIGRMLEEHGFERLYENEKWELARGKSYYVTRNSSSVMAFRIPEEVFTGFRLICSHTDSPSFKVKENPEMEIDRKYIRLNVEKYGGMLCAPWFDRPLSLAGRLLVRQEDGVRQVLVNIDRDLLMIPNLAIHMNRSANEGVSYHAQVDMCPVFGDETSKDGFSSMLAKEAGVGPEDILGTDLYVYNRQKGTIWGANGEFIGGPRLDDLQCVFATLEGFLAAEEKKVTHVSVFCAFDNEETGSVSRQGAASTFLQDTLMRISEGMGQSAQEYRMTVAGSFMISADNAHALHPAHPETADPVNRPQMNHGIVVKYNANQKYTTDAVSAAVFKRLCEKAEVPYQTFTNRSDMPGGSTLGNISNTQVSMRCVDIGLAQLAMHSPYEMAGIKDTWYLQRAAEVFYRTALCFGPGEEIRFQ